MVKILEYLGGIETEKPRNLQFGRQLILEYLGGIETIADKFGKATHLLLILEYLGGIETRQRLILLIAL